MNATPAPECRRTEDLIDAACEGDAREIRRLLAMGLDPDTRDENGFPILALAAVEGNAAAVRTILEFGAQIEAKDPEGNTALRWAADEGHIDAAQALLERGAQIEVMNGDGFSPMYCALTSRQFYMVKLLRAHLEARGASTAPAE